jgi:hypothetical protein
MAVSRSLSAPHQGQKIIEFPTLVITLLLCSLLNSQVHKLRALQFKVDS